MYTRARTSHVAQPWRMSAYVVRLQFNHYVQPSQALVQLIDQLPLFSLANVQKDVRSCNLAHYFKQFTNN